jgi:hypothetical protein
MKTFSRSTLMAFVAVAAGACADDRPNALPLAPMEVGANELSAYVVVSDPDPAIGSRFTVSVRARRGAAVGRIGSFTLRVAFDTSRLRFVEASRSTEGMVMTNVARPGELVAAGASAEGFTTEELLVATFTAVSADAVESLALTVSELNSVAFENQRQLVRVRPGAFRDVAPPKK